MVRTGKTLTVADIVEINRRMIAQFGGIFFEGDNNLAQPGSLDHLLSEIHGSLFGQELYPDIFQKAGLISWRIILRHIFHDGNKRTGMEACRLFFDLNGYRLLMDMTIVDAALKIATHQIEFDEYVDWLKQRTTGSEI